MSNYNENDTLARFKRTARAREAAKNIPKEARTAWSVRTRHSFVWDLLAKDPFLTNEKLHDASHAKFGVGVSARALARMRRAMKKHGAMTTPSHGDANSLMNEKRKDQSAHMRHAFVRDLLAGNPYATNKELTDKSIAKFGIGVSAGTMAKIRRSMKGRDSRASAVHEETANPSPSAPTESDLHTAVELIFSSVPNLLTFNISVNDDGEADVSYTIKEVKVVKTSGNLKVKR
jgi:hypothetical protein